jgi:hypothetical protein
MAATQFPQLKRVPLYDAEKDAAPRTVCVTGASSYVAGSIIPRLLAAGHTVHATVRNPGDKRKVAHLEAMGAAAGGRLKLFKVGSWLVAALRARTGGHLRRAAPPAPCQPYPRCAPAAPPSLPPPPPRSTLLLRPPPRRT